MLCKRAEVGTVRRELRLCRDHDVVMVFGCISGRDRLSWPRTEFQHCREHIPRADKSQPSAAH